MGVKSTDRPLAVLAEVKWLAGPETAALSPFLGADFGFSGVGRSPPADLAHARQVHGRDGWRVTQRPVPDVTAERPAADFVWTTAPGVRVGVKTADCLPILITDRNRRIAMAVHAGWRGLTAGVIASAVEAAETAGVPAGTLVAVVGPALCREHFEVGPEVLAAAASPVLGLSPAELCLVMAKGRGDRWHLDLQVAAAVLLTAGGLPPAAVSVVQTCTLERPEWFSYRREGRVTGSNWAWIGLS